MLPIHSHVFLAWQDKGNHSKDSAHKGHLHKLVNKTTLNKHSLIYVEGSHSGIHIDQPEQHAHILTISNMSTFL